MFRLSATSILKNSSISGNCFHLYIPGANFGFERRLHDTYVVPVLKHEFDDDVLRRGRFAEGSVYEGAFVGGKMHGWGALYTHEGNLWFEGEWKNGERVQKKGASGPPPPSR